MIKKTVGKLLEVLGIKKQGIKADLYIRNFFRSMEARTRLIVVPYLIKRRSNHGVFAVNLNSDWLGLGARIVKTLEILLYCEENNLTPLIQYNYQQKNKANTDYFGELFYYKHANKKEFQKAKYTDTRYIYELGWKADYNIKLKLSFAKTLFDKYLGINQDILTEVDQFCKNNFHNKRVLGVHYRGTDKAGEAPPVAKETLLHEIREVLAERKELQILFLSSDDEQIIHYVKESGLIVPVVSREDAMRSNDGDQFHRKKEVSKLVVNRDAIINMLLLSRCNYLLKTASILSECSVIFNPSIEVKLLNKPHSEALTWWPLRELLGIETMDGDTLYDLKNKVRIQH
jgi:hypothetical protein